MKKAYRYQIWKNNKIVSDCQRLSTLLSRLYKITRASKVEESSIWYSDTETGEINDASELIPDWGK